MAQQPLFPHVTKGLQSAGGKRWIVRYNIRDGENEYDNIFITDSPDPDYWKAQYEKNGMKLDRGWYEEPKGYRLAKLGRHEIVESLEQVLNFLGG